MERIEEEIRELKEWKLESFHFDELLELIEKWAKEARMEKEHEDDYPETSELILKALAIFKRHGLTPNELYDKYNFLLSGPYEKWNSHSYHAVSMLLIRACSNGLADRIRETKTYRYFINSNGESRLEYYRKKRIEKQKQKSQAKEFAREFASAIELGTQTVANTTHVQQAIEILAKRYSSSFSEIYSLGGKMLVEIAGTMNLAQTAIHPGADSELRVKAMKQINERLEEMKTLQVILSMSIMTAWQLQQQKNESLVLATALAVALAYRH
jgi:hypothetical protein